MKILFLSDNFPPEVNAPASRTYEHCHEWVNKGHEVTVITCVPNFPQGRVYSGYKNKLWQKEVIDDIKVFRVWSYIVANEGFLKRTLDYISYSITSFIAGLFIDTDVIIATSPQFFTALSGRTLALLKRKPWIMEVRDLWPESIKTVGALKDSPIIRYLEWQEMRCYHSAKKIVVVTDSFKKRLIERGIDTNKIAVIKNGVNKNLFAPQDKDTGLLDQLNLEGKFVIGYIGTHGMAHKLDFILKCAKLLKQQTDIHFLFIGNGAKKNECLELMNKLQLKNITMLDTVAHNEVKRYISVIDVALINLKKSDMFRYVIPSKIFENACMEKPILLGVEGEAKDIIEHYGAGVCFEPENENDFISKLASLKDEATYKHCQEGCRVLACNFDRRQLANNMLDIITSMKN